MTFDEVVDIALALPGTAQGTSYGTPALKVGSKLLARLRDDGDLVLKVADGLRETLLETRADVFHTTPHYAGYPVLLVRLAVTDGEQLAGLVEQAWAGLASAKLRRARV